MTNPIKILDFFTRVRKIKWEKIPKASAFGRIFWDWMEITEYPPEGYIFNSFNLKNAPIPFEIQFNLSNASDCADWMKENLVDNLQIPDKVIA